MKTTFFTLMLTFSASAFAETKMASDVCLKLMISTTSDIFLSDDTGDILKGHDLHDKKDADLYFNKVSKKLTDKLSGECISNKNSYTLEKFKTAYAETCANECRYGVSVLDTTVLNSIAKKDRARNVCYSICKQGNDKLSFVKQGIDMAKSNSEKAAPDCNGVVADSGRDKTKEPSWDKVQQSVGAGLNAVHLERTKKASGK